MNSQRLFFPTQRPGQERCLSSPFPWQVHKWHISPNFKDPVFCRVCQLPTLPGSTVVSPVHCVPAKSQASQPRRMAYSQQLIKTHVSASLSSLAPSISLNLAECLLYLLSISRYFVAGSSLRHSWLLVCQNRHQFYAFFWKK